MREVHNLAYFVDNAEAAVVYMTAPLFVTLLSALILRERVGLHRWSAVVIGFGAATNRDRSI